MKSKMEREWLSRVGIARTGLMIKFHEKMTTQQVKIMWNRSTKRNPTRNKILTRITRIFERKIRKFLKNKEKLGECNNNNFILD